MSVLNCFKMIGFANMCKNIEVWSHATVSYAHYLWVNCIAKLLTKCKDKKVYAYTPKWALTFILFTIGLWPFTHTILHTRQMSMPESNTQAFLWHPSHLVYKVALVFSFPLVRSCGSVDNRPLKPLHNWLEIVLVT